MQLGRRRPGAGLCLFCSLRSSAAAFSTSSTRQRRTLAQEKLPPELRGPRIILQGSNHETATRTRAPRRSAKQDVPDFLPKLESLLGALHAETAESPATSMHRLLLPSNTQKQSIAFQRLEDTSQQPAPSPVPFRLTKHLSQRQSLYPMPSYELVEGEFERRVKNRLKSLSRRLHMDPIFTKIGLDETDLKLRFDMYEKSISALLDQPRSKRPGIFKPLQDAYRESGIDGLEMEIKYAFYGYIMMARFTSAELENQKQLADLRHPSEWFPLARCLQRQIHLHVGPTNSGKTYQALKRLEETDGAGVYAGPLRLLAHEVYMRLNARGLPCKLITGEEQRPPPTDLPSHELDRAKTSCTVEMMPLSQRMKVAVIDEIQMIGDNDRGWAWTQAFLGVQADEVHLCGEERSIPIIRELTAAIGDKLEIHRYQRLSPLAMMSHSLKGNIRKLQKGDCIVAFSVVLIHGLRQLIEKTLGRKVAVIYGSLPPETRAQQARLFNDPNNDYDFLVASDAVGMGLNLNIKRMIFHSSQKFYDNKHEKISIADIKQIAGRAGRFSTAEDDMKKGSANNAPHQLDLENLTARPTLSRGSNTMGLVTSLEETDFRTIEGAMTSEADPILSAGIFPPASVLEAFAKYFPPETPFSYVFMRLHELSRIHPRFHLCDLKQNIRVLDAIASVEGLSVKDKVIICTAPINPRKQNEAVVARSFARYIAENQAVSISDVEALDLEILEEKRLTGDLLRRLEHLHKSVMLFIWLSYRFSGVFISRELAFHVKELVEDKIESTLRSLSIDLNELARARELAMQNQMRRQAVAGAKAARDLEDRLRAERDTSSSSELEVSKIHAEFPGLIDATPMLRGPLFQRRTAQQATGSHHASRPVPTQPSPLAPAHQTDPPPLAPRDDHALETPESYLRPLLKIGKKRLMLDTYYQPDAQDPDAVHNDTAPAKRELRTHA